MAADFVDTNLIVYLLEQDPAKAERVEHLIAAGAIVSVQVLNELANVARRKRPDRWPDTVEFLSGLRGIVEVIPLTEDIHAAAIELVGRYRLSVYDALIVASALLAGCTTLWSEDMQDGLLVERQLTIRNPFAQPPA